jgi:hypothetical protein
MWYITKAPQLCTAAKDTSVIYGSSILTFHLYFQQKPIILLQNIIFKVTPIL